MALTKAQLIDLNGNELILDLNGNTSLTADTDDQIDIKIGGADDFTFTANAFNVLTGSHATFADSANAKFGTGSDMLVYHDGSNSYITNAVGALKIATETSGIALTIGHTTSEVTIADNLTVTGTLTLGSGAELTEAELEFLDGITAGTAAANKALVLDGSKNIATIGTIASAAITSSGIVTATGFTAGSAVLAEAELELLDGITAGTAAANKALVLDGSKNIATIGTIASAAITSSGIITGTAFTAGSAVLAEAELELLDGLTAGTAIASKVVTTDGSIDTTGQRNLTITGELDAATGDFSGVVDVAGAFTTGSTIVSTGKITSDAGIDIDNFNIDGTTIALSSGDLTVDVAGDIILDAAGDTIFLKDAGTTFGSLDNNSANLIIKSGTTTALTFSGANVTAAGTIGSGAITSTGIVTGTAFTAGSAVLAEAELELLDGLTAGTAIASKVVTTDGSIDTSGQRNLTISGELDAATLDISGAIDIAGASVLHGLLTQDGGAIFNEASADVDFRVESNGEENMLVVDGGSNFVGIGTATGVRTLNITDTTAGANMGIHILSANDATQSIQFADSDDANIGGIQYDHSTNKLLLRANDVYVSTYTSGEVVFNDASNDQDFRVETNGLEHALFLSNDNSLYLGTSTGNSDPGGITANQGANDNNIIALQSSDVAHGITDSAATSTYGMLKKISGADGGFQIESFSEGTQAFRVQGTVTTATTTHSSATGAVGAIIMDGNIKSGTGAVDLPTNANVFVVKANNDTRFIVDQEGDLHSDGGAQSAYDEYDDAQLVRAYDLSHGNGTIDSKFDKFIAYNHEHLADLKLVGREDDGTPNHFINVTGMQRLHNGAIWQQYEKHNQLLEAVYELAEKAIGKKEAKAILDKHEVKRLN